MKVAVVLGVGVLVSAIAGSARAQAAMEPTWAQVSMGPSGAVDVVVYGGSQYAYQGWPDQDGRARDFSRSLYMAGGTDLPMNLLGVERRRLYPGAGMSLDRFRVAKPILDSVVLTDVSGDERILDFRLAPSGAYVALRETLDGAGTLNVHPDVRMVVLDLDPDRMGEKVLDVDSVRRYAWNASGDRLTFITGVAYEGGIGFLPTAVSWVDVGVPEVLHEIHRGGGWDLGWADDQIYLWDFTDQGARVLRYDTNSDELEETSHQGVHFAPDGRYYFEPAVEGEPFRLYETAQDGGEDLELTETRSGDGKSLFLVSPAMRYAQPRGWLDSRTLVVPSGGSREGIKEYLYFVDEDKCLEIEGAMVGKAERGVVVLTRDVEMLVKSMDALATCALE